MAAIHQSALSPSDIVKLFTQSIKTTFKPIANEATQEWEVGYATLNGKKFKVGKAIGSDEYFNLVVKAGEEYIYRVQPTKSGYKLSIVDVTTDPENQTETEIKIPSTPIKKAPTQPPKEATKEAKKKETSPAKLTTSAKPITVTKPSTTSASKPVIVNKKAIGTAPTSKSVPPKSKPSISSPLKPTGSKKDQEKKPVKPAAKSPSKEEEVINFPHPLFNNMPVITEEDLPEIEESEEDDSPLKGKTEEEISAAVSRWVKKNEFVNARTIREKGRVVKGPVSIYYRGSEKAVKAAGIAIGEGFRYYAVQVSEKKGGKKGSKQVRPEVIYRLPDDAIEELVKLGEDRADIASNTNQTTIVKALLRANGVTPPTKIQDALTKSFLKNAGGEFTLLNWFIDVVTGINVLNPWKWFNKKDKKDSNSDAEGQEEADEEAENGKAEEDEEEVEGGEENEEEEEQEEQEQEEEQEAEDEEVEGGEENEEEQEQEEEAEGDDSFHVENEQEEAEEAKVAESNKRQKQQTPLMKGSNKKQKN